MFSRNTIFTLHLSENWTGENFVWTAPEVPHIQHLSGYPLLHLPLPQWQWLIEMEVPGRGSSSSLAAPLVTGEADQEASSAARRERPLVARLVKQVSGPFEVLDLHTAPQITP